MSGLSNGATHDVILQASMGNTVYAFDALVVLSFGQDGHGVGATVASAGRCPTSSGWRLLRKRTGS